MDRVIVSATKRLYSATAAIGHGSGEVKPGYGRTFRIKFSRIERLSLFSRSRRVHFFVVVNCTSLS